MLQNFKEQACPKRRDKKSLLLQPFTDVGDPQVWHMAHIFRFYWCMDQLYWLFLHFCLLWDGSLRWVWGENCCDTKNPQAINKNLFERKKERKKDFLWLKLAWNEFCLGKFGCWNGLTYEDLLGGRVCFSVA